MFRNRGYLIEDENAIEPAWLEGAAAVALTTGASAPEELVERVVDRLRALGFSNVEDVELIPEDLRFTLPAELVPYTSPTAR